MAIKNKFSERQAGFNTVVDVAGVQRSVMAKHIAIAGGTYTQNTTVKTTGGPLGFAGTLIAAYISYSTIPAGGTLGARLVAYDASANAEVNLTTVFDPETLTAREAAAMTLDTTNVELAAEDTLEFHTIASNDVVSNAGAGGFITCYFIPAASTTIDE